MKAVVLAFLALAVSALALDPLLDPQPGAWWQAMDRNFSCKVSNITYNGQLWGSAVVTVVASAVDNNVGYVNDGTVRVKFGTKEISVKCADVPPPIRDQVIAAWKVFCGTLDVEEIAKRVEDREHSARNRAAADRLKAGQIRITGTVLRSNAQGAWMTNLKMNPPDFFVLCDTRNIADSAEYSFWVTDLGVMQIGDSKLQCYRAMPQP